MITLPEFGIFISAIGGIITIYEKFFNKKDNFIVRYGPYRPVMDDREALHVVNKSQHPISIRDYGFILEDGTLYSFVWTSECSSPDDDYDLKIIGSCDNIEFTRYVEFWCRTKNDIVGAYAISSTQKFPRLCFKNNISLLRRLLIKIKILLNYLKG